MVGKVFQRQQVQTRRAFQAILQSLHVDVVVCQLQQNQHHLTPRSLQHSKFSFCFAPVFPHPRRAPGPMLFRARRAVVPRDRWLAALATVASGHLRVGPLFLAGHELVNDRVNTQERVNTSGQHISTLTGQKIPLRVVRAEIFNLGCVVNRDSCKLGPVAALVDAVNRAHISLFRFGCSPHDDRAVEAKAFRLLRAFLGSAKVVLGGKRGHSALAGDDVRLVGVHFIFGSLFSLVTCPQCHTVSKRQQQRAWKKAGLIPMGEMSMGQLRHDLGHGGVRSCFAHPLLASPYSNPRLHPGVAAIAHTPPLVVWPGATLDRDLVPLASLADRLPVCRGLDLRANAPSGDSAQMAGDAK